MPAIDYAPQGPVIVVVFSEAQGQEGRQISQAAAQAIHHFEDRAGHHSMLSNEDRTWSYSSVPLNMTDSVRVEYRYIGELPLLPYEYDE